MIWTDEKILARVALGAKVGMGLALVLAAVSVVLAAVGVRLNVGLGFLAGATVMLVAASFACGYGIASLKGKHTEWRLGMHQHVDWLLRLWLEAGKGTRDDVVLHGFFGRDDAYSDEWYMDAKSLARHLQEAA